MTEQQTPENAPAAPFTVGGQNLAFEAAGYRQPEDSEAARNVVFDSRAEVPPAPGIEQQSAPASGGETEQPPPQSAVKAEHVDYVAEHSDIPRDEAEGMTKDELVAEEKEIAAAQDNPPPGS